MSGHKCRLKLSLTQAIARYHKLHKISRATSEYKLPQTKASYHKRKQAVNITSYTSENKLSQVTQSITSNTSYTSENKLSQGTQAITTNSKLSQAIASYHKLSQATRAKTRYHKQKQLITHGNKLAQYITSYASESKL